MRRVLMIAYHFPPLAGSSGIQRTLRFAQDLPALGWEPILLSASPRAYERTSQDLMTEVPAGLSVHRAFALDAARHLAIRGRYFAAAARPDRWASWRWDGVRSGRKLIERFRPDVIWSTYPIATAHSIASALQRSSSLPWIADFRDPMVQGEFPDDPLTRKRLREIELDTALNARRLTVTTQGAARGLLERYPGISDKVAVIENGYDDQSFLSVERRQDKRCPLESGKLTILHSGIIYPLERDPSGLFEALRRLKSDGTGIRLKIRFRAPVHSDLLRDLAVRYDVESMVDIFPAIEYKEALAEMLRADGLLVIQAGNCNDQIPAKVYEYMRARRPIVCLADPAGDTWSVLEASGVNRMANLADPAQVADLLREFATGDIWRLVADETAVARSSRLVGAQNLAQLLSASLGEQAGTPSSYSI